MRVYVAEVAYDRIRQSAVLVSGYQHRSAGLFRAPVDFDVSVANLVLIAVMVVIFGVALLLLFPRDAAKRPPLPAAPRMKRRTARLLGRPTRPPPGCGCSRCGTSLSKRCRRTIRARAYTRGGGTHIELD